MGPKSVRVSQFVLDTLNPRIAGAANQRDAMQRLFDDQGERLAALADDIVANGASPIERLLVMKDPDDPGKYIALEGNRRILVLKVLNNPHMLGGFEIKSAVKKRLEELSQAFKKNPITSVDAYELGDREQARHWIQLRHIGAGDGRGVVTWSGVATARFRGEEPALQALEFVAKYGGLSEHDEALVRSLDFPITTLDRLIKSRDVRSLLGFGIEKRKLVSGLPADELIKPLKRIVLDLAHKRVTVSRVKNAKDQVSYVHGFEVHERPNLKSTGVPRPVEEIGASDFKKRTARPTKKKARDPNDRLTLAPNKPRLNVDNAKTAEIYKELRGLRVSEYPHACAILLRVFLELSVDHYLEKAGIPTTYTDRGGSTRDKSLQIKVQETAEHLVRSGGSQRRDFEGVQRALSVKESPLHIDLLHGYVHSRFTTPTSDRELKAAWNQAERFFERIWA